MDAFPILRTLAVKEEGDLSQHERLEQACALSALSDFPEGMAQGALDVQALAALVGSLEWVHERIGIAKGLAALLSPLGVDADAFVNAVLSSPGRDHPLDGFDPRSTAKYLAEEIDTARRDGPKYAVGSVSEFFSREVGALVEAYESSVGEELAAAGYDPDWSALEDPLVVGVEPSGVPY